MIYTPDDMMRDMSPFVDLGAPSPKIAERDGRLITTFIRNGDDIQMIVMPDGKVVERIEVKEIIYQSIGGILASTRFCDLARWAYNQKHFLKEKVEQDSIVIYGKLSNGSAGRALQLLDECTLVQEGDAPRVSLTLLNGPAGIGKTSLIKTLSYSRANEYSIKRRPLVLHVESRGRTLQNINDLVAFSLQTLRLSITYDQVPALVRYGLIVLAIDGFDELGDPNGYDLAWAQLNELVVEARGSGLMVLAGRDTFVGKERLYGALSAVNDQHDQIETLQIDTIRPSTAKEWLLSQGWPEDAFDIPNIKTLVEPTSYALRPYFLAEMVKPGVLDELKDGVVGDLFTFLVSSMERREATKFGDDIDALTSEPQRVSFVRILMEEIARDIAENQSNAISVDTIVWLSEVVASEIVPPTLIGILKNRASVIAFLTSDDRRDYRRFVHEKVLDYFLSHVAFKVILKGELPKFIRRNVFGADFYDTFVGVARSYSALEAQEFLDACIAHATNMSDQDRAKQNIKSLIISITSVFSFSETIVISNASIDEAFVCETPSSVVFRNVTIGQLIARSADLKNYVFEEGSQVVALVADEGTDLSETFPLPHMLILPTEMHTDPRKISDWISTKQVQRILSEHDVKSHEIPYVPSSLGLINLMYRVARYRPYWIKEGDEQVGAQKILADVHWENLKEIMRRNNLLLERSNLQVSGRPSNFYHVRKRDEFLRLTPPSAEVKAAIAEIVMAELIDRRRT